MKALMAGIYAHYNATNALKTALTGGMHPHSAPSGVSFPYGVYYVSSIITGYDFSDDHEQVSVQFSLFSEESSPDQVLTLFEHLKTLFDDANITVSGWRVIRFQRDTSQLIKDQMQETWGYHVDYDILLEKTR